MDITHLTRQSHRQTRPGLSLLGQFNLAGARVHEFCGPARRRLALWLARKTTTRPVGQILWIRPEWHPDTLHMAGVQTEIDPAGLVFVEPHRPADILWSMEEALRSGVVSLVVADLIDAPGLTPVRRLHLAAEAGANRTGHAPLGLLLTQGEGGAAGVETRWSLRPEHASMARDCWRLKRVRARSDPPADWAITRNAKGEPVIQKVDVCTPA